MPQPEAEPELSDVFEWAVGDAVPDLGLLVAGATAEGSAIRRRRRAALGGAVVAVAGLALGGGLLLRPGTPTAAVSPGAGNSAPSAPAPEATLPPDPVPLTGAAGMVVLGRLIGPDLVVDSWSSNANPVSTDRRTVIVARVHERGTKRISTIEIEVLAAGNGPLPTSERLDCADRPGTGLCEPVRGLNGEYGVMYTFRSDSQQIGYATKLRRPRDGVQISLSVTGMAGTEPAVPLSTVSKWALSTDWQPTIDRRQAELAEQQVKTFTHQVPVDQPSPSLRTPDSGTGTWPSQGPTGDGTTP
ncbi:hypothetical protein [Kitasatospora sp. NPDC059673]|uniref:hypothetical protein n=1 Tax=Kitasatospora sp. NPDC059673 TaxID=3346901 RepID=UPI00368250C9